MNIDIDKLKEKLVNNQDVVLGRNEKYYNSAILIPIVNINNDMHLLFQLRQNNIRQGGEICFPGGLINRNTDNNFIDTVIRETCEELGIDKAKIDLFGMLGVLIAPMGAAVNAYVGSINIDDIEELKICKNEVEKIFTIPLDYFIINEPKRFNAYLEVKSWFENKEGVKEILLPVEELGLPERYLKPWGNRKNRVFVYYTAQGIIWGLTAELIFEFVKILIQ